MRFLPSRLRRVGGGCAHTNRGLERFDEVLRSAGTPTLGDLVADRTRRGRVRVLEVGCGEGRLLLDLAARFGPEVELHGINGPGWPVVADARGIAATNARYRVLPRRSLRRRGAPTVHLGDAQDLSASGLGLFDVIVSQVVVPHVAGKHRVLEESARLLAPGGVFLHEVENLADGPAGPRDEWPRWRIRDGGVEVAAPAHLARCGVEVRLGRVGDRVASVAAYRESAGPLDLRLVEVATVALLGDTTVPEANRWGVRSEYRVRADADAAAPPLRVDRAGSGPRASPRDA
jgi:SAM-dependent methyltransferase